MGHLVNHFEVGIGNMVGEGKGRAGEWEGIIPMPSPGHDRVVTVGKHSIIAMCIRAAQRKTRAGVGQRAGKKGGLIRSEMGTRESNGAEKISMMQVLNCHMEN